MTKVERLHTEGKKYYSYPYRLYVLDNTDGDADETVISVPKKIFKRAVKRGRSSAIWCAAGPGRLCVI